MSFIDLVLASFLNTYIVKLVYSCLIAIITNGCNTNILEILNLNKKHFDLIQTNIY